ncbi:unnamed protein product [Paramecium sonneborni]|uniref:Uncharacterized protein n=1 Tax=Paramecium sonneborni TaxID=65129 RepID=A0A8S1NA34_9CILI|nr:unnamed protein product [Paramecium sonneborni]
MNHNSNLKYSMMINLKLYSQTAFSYLSVIEETFRLRVLIILLQTHQSLNSLFYTSIDSCQQNAKCYY